MFDFTGTGYESHGNCNAPRAVALSALIYCLRSMVKHDIPLNQVQLVFYDCENREKLARKPQGNSIPRALPGFSVV